MENFGQKKRDSENKRVEGSRARARVADMDGQMEIFSPTELTDCTLENDIMERIRSDEEAGRYTSMRLKKLKPQSYVAAREMLARGLPTTDIARALGVHFYTVDAIAQEEADYIAQTKQKLSRGMFSAAQQAMEKILQGLEKVQIGKPEDIYKMSLVASTLVEKGQLLTGGATQRVETKETKTYESAEDYEKDIWDIDEEAGNEE